MQFFKIWLMSKKTGLDWTKGLCEIPYKLIPQTASKKPPFGVYKPPRHMSHYYYGQFPSAKKGQSVHTVKTAVSFQHSKVSV
jgi:hypothetical protein